MSLCCGHCIIDILIPILVPLFLFTENSYSVREDMGPATLAIELWTVRLTFIIIIRVSDVIGGTATGEIMAFK